MRATSSLRSFLSSLKQEKRAASPAFTIVELLIVIVIIAILAAITLVSYNGIQQRAKASSAQSLLSQAVSKVKLYAIDHSDQYPSLLTDAGITDTTNLQYSSTSSTYCITATAQNVSYYQNTTTDTPTKGACPGHGVDGGGVVTNLAVNPRGDITKMGWLTRYSMSGLEMDSSDGPLSGLNSYFRETQGAEVTGAGRGIDHYGNIDLVDGAVTSQAIPVSQSKVYAVTSYVRSSVANASVRIWCKIHDAAGNWLGGTYGQGEKNYTTPNQWIRPSLVFTATDSGYLTCTTRFQASVTWTAGSTIDGTGLMITEGSTVYPYADPTTNSSWAWNGTPNSSTSTGPTP